MRNEDKHHYAQLEELQMRITMAAESIGHLKWLQKKALYADDWHQHDLLDGEIDLEQTKIKQLERSYELIRNQK